MQGAVLIPVPAGTEPRSELWAEAEEAAAREGGRLTGAVEMVGSIPVEVEGVNLSHMVGFRFEMVSV